MQAALPRKSLLSLQETRSDVTLAQVLGLADWGRATGTRNSLPAAETQTRAEPALADLRLPSLLIFDLIKRLHAFCPPHITSVSSLPPRELQIRVLHQPATSSFLVTPPGALHAFA